MMGGMREDAPPAFHLLAKPTGAVCNLDCSYCFFLSKEMLYPGSRFRMAQELQEIHIRQLLDAHQRAPEVVVAWQGGRAHDHGTRLLPPLDRTATRVRETRAADPEHAADQRDAAR